MRTSSIEVRDLFKAWVAISLAFAILLRGNGDFYAIFLISGFTVGLGFLLHELGHKFLAQKYGCIAEFRSNDSMLLLAIAISFFGFIIAAPGGVYISGRHLSVEQNGKISMMGPLMNLVLALIFFFVPGLVGNIGFTINSWLALFNLLPFGIFDGRKVFNWNKVVYVTMLVIAIIFVLGGFF